VVLTAVATLALVRRMMDWFADLMSLLGKLVLVVISGNWHLSRMVPEN
jgi:hypothetical protein